MTKIDESREAECRAEFEQWQASNGSSPTMAANGRYVWDDVNDNWRVWQACWSARDGHGAAVGVQPFEVTDEIVKFLMKYGGYCRDCAEDGPVCPMNGVGCGQGEKAVRWFLKAFNYGLQNKFIELARHSAAVGWYPMHIAPKDGTKIIILFRHKNYQYAEGEDKKNWEQECEASWTKFNGGGWCWSGMYGDPICWKPCVSGDAQPSDDSRRGDVEPYDDTKACILADRQYLAGMKAGWNFGVADDHAGYLAVQSAMQKEMREAKSDASAAEKPEPVAWAVVDKNIGFTSLSATYTIKKLAQDHVDGYANTYPLQVIPLYTHPAPRGADAELIEALQNARDMVETWADRYIATDGLTISHNWNPAKSKAQDMATLSNAIDAAISGQGG